MSILMIGLNHKVAPVAVRERLAFGPERVSVALRELTGAEKIEINEAALLSTCNRTEIYICTCDSTAGEARLHDFLADHAKLSLERLRRIVYTVRGEAAAEHLMQVAAGLDSLVLGENEILGQVRSAAEMAHDAGATGPILSALFRYAIQAGKRARAETEIGRGDVSVASVVVELAEQVLGPLHDRTALLIGAGKISAITARALVKAGLRCIMIANRTFEKAQKLARNLNGTAVHFDALSDVLTQADIVICSTGAPHYILMKDEVHKIMKERKQKPMFIIDISVPRNIDPAINDLDNVYLYDVDNLQGIIDTNIQERAKEAEKAEQIVDEEIGSFLKWTAALTATPTIVALRNKAEEIRKNEVEKTLLKMGPLEEKTIRSIEQLTSSIVNKLIHPPTAALKAEEDDKEQMLGIIQKLYNLQIESDDNDKT